MLFVATAVPIVAPAQQDAKAPPLVFDSVTVVDVEQGKLVQDQRVVIQGNRIQVVGNSGTVPVPKGAQVIEARGKYLMPGLWDMHVHPLHGAPEIYYPLFIANGITGIRDAGSDVPLDTLQQWRREILAGTRVGPPRQLLSGPYLNADCSGGPAICVSDSVRARQVVDSLAAAGADMIKPRDVDLATYFAIAAAARHRGIPFGGHISWEAVQEGITYLAASDSGAKIIDHDAMKVTDIFNCWGQETTLEDCRPVAERFRRNGTWWVPTVVAYGTTLVSARGAAAYDRFTARVRRFWGDSTNDTATEDSSLATGASPPPSTVDSTPGSLGYGYVAQRLEIPLLAGTDTYDDPVRLKRIPPGFSLHGELAIYVAEGITPLHALQSATLAPAKFLHATDSLGTVAPGKLADLVLLDADPLADITNTTAIHAVVANGRYYDRALLDSLMHDARARADAQP